MTSAVLQWLLAGIQAEMMRAKGAKVVLLCVKEYVAIDEARRAERRRLRAEGVPLGPPPPPLMPNKLLAALRDQVLGVVFPKRDSGFLNGALETSFLDPGEYLRFVTSMRVGLHCLRHKPCRIAQVRGL